MCSFETPSHALQTYPSEAETSPRILKEAEEAAGHCIRHTSPLEQPSRRVPGAAVVATVMGCSSLAFLLWLLMPVRWPLSVSTWAPIMFRKIEQENKEVEIWKTLCLNENKNARPG